MVATPRGDRHRGALQGDDRTRAAHVHGRRVAHVLDAEVGRDMLGGGAERRSDDAVDIVRLETGVGDRLGRSIEHQTAARSCRSRGVNALSPTPTMQALSLSEYISYSFSLSKT